MKRNNVLAQSEYGRLPSALAVEVGDIIQCDLGLRIVIEVGKQTATAITIIGSDKPKAIELEISKSRIIERRGADGLKFFLQRKRGLQDDKKQLTQNQEEDEDMKGTIRLEPGDQLTHGGEQRTVVQVTDRRALLENANGLQIWENRRVNDFLFSTNGVVLRFDEADRAKHLEKFLASRKPSVAGETTTHGEQKEDTDMAKARVKSGKPEKKVKAVKAVKAKKEKLSASTNGDDNNKLFGHPVTAIVRTLGKAGATLEDVERVVKAHKIELRSANTIARNFKFGQLGKYETVSLTKEQLAEFGV